MNDMTTLQLMLWVVFPYMVLAVFVLGHVWRFKADRFGWTTRSSQIYESKLLSIGSPLFHYGIIGIFFGHVVGLGIPKSWTRFLGISDHVYHLMAVTIGLAAAAACVGGLMILLYRRRTNVRVFGATTVGDKIMYLLLAATIVCGVLATVVHHLRHVRLPRGRVDLVPRLLTLRPSVDLMAQARSSSSCTSSRH